jgi:RimJ/RimL family protein N-acetyltransferase
MLIGKNIIFRPLKKSDQILTQKWRNDLFIIKQAQLVRFPKTSEIEDAWFDRVLHDISNKNIYFGIDEISSGEFIGIIQLTNIDWISGTCDWGFIIGEKNKRGLGYGVEAPRLLFDYAFKILNLRKITGYPIVFNKETLRMHEKLGNFIEEGRLKEHVFFDDKYHDVLILSLFKKDYKSVEM